MRNNGKQTVDGSHWLPWYGKHTMEDNGDLKLFGYTHFFFLHSISFCVQHKKKKVRVSKWQNCHVFGWTIPLSSTTLIVPVIRNVSWASNQHIRMISEGSRDTEDWNTGCWKWTFAITEKKKKNGSVCNTAKKSTLDILQNFSFCVPQKGFKWHFIFVWTIPSLKFKKCN